MFSPQIDKYRFRAGLNLKEIHKLKLKEVLHPGIVRAFLDKNDVALSILLGLKNVRKGGGIFLKFSNIF